MTEVSPARAWVRLVVATGLSRAGDQLFALTILVEVYARTRSAAWVTAVTLARLVPAVVLTPAAGALADRVGHRRALVGSSVAGAAVLLAAAALPVSTALLVALAGIGTVLDSVRRPALTAIVPAVAGARPAALNTWLTVAEHGASIGGPALGLLLLRASSVKTAIVLDAVTFLVAAVSYPRPTAERASPAASPPVTCRPTVRGALGLARRSPRLRGLVLCLVAYGACDGVMAVSLVVFAGERFGSSALAALEGCVGIGGLAAAAVASRAASRRGSPGLALGAVGAPLLFLALAGDLAPAMVLLAVHGAALMVFDVATLTALQESAPAGQRAAVAGLTEAVTVAAVAGGVAVAPLLLALTGTGATVTMAGGVLLVAGAVSCRPQWRPATAQRLRIAASR